MKRIINLAKVFTPFIYRWIILPAVTLGMLALGTFLTAGLGDMGYVIALFLDGEALLFADLVVFNGVGSKNVQYKLLMAANSGRDVFKGGLLTDNLIRFLQMAFTGFLCWIFGRSMNPEWTASFGFALIVVLTAYALGTLALVALRHVSTVTMYGPILSLVSVLIVVPLLALQAVYELPGLDQFAILPIGALIVVVILVVLAVLISVANVLKNYDKSFGGRR